VARGRAIGDGHAAGGTWPGEVRDRDDATGEGTCQGEGTRPRNDAGQGGRAAREVAQAREGARGGGRKRERRRDGERRGGGGGSTPRVSTIATTVHRITPREKEVEEREVAARETKMR
jgi:hypothetical protein